MTSKSKSSKSKEAKPIEKQLWEAADGFVA